MLSRVFLAFVILFHSNLYADDVMFHPEIRWGEPHTLSFNFNLPQKNWGKISEGMITLRCDHKHEIKSQWLNSKSIKSVIAPELIPGESCQIGFQGKSYVLRAPEIKIIEVGPWSISNNFHEEDPIYINTDYPLNGPKLIQELTLEIEGIEEKIEFDLLQDQVALDALKKQFDYIKTPIVWVKPRQKLPAGRKFKLHLKKGQTAGFVRDGNTRDHFKVEISCERPKADEPCVPLSNLYVRFNASIDTKYFREIYYTLNGQKVYLEKNLEQLSESSYFKTPLPAESEIEIHLPPELSDWDGRRLTNIDKFPLKIKIGEFPPLAKLPGAFGILESDGNPIVPVAIRNIDQPLTLQFNTVNINRNSAKDILDWQFEITQRQGQGYEKDFRGVSVFDDKKIKLQTQTLKTTVKKSEIELLGLPLAKKGLYIIEVVSPKLGTALLNSNECASSAGLI